MMDALVKLASDNSGQAKSANLDDAIRIADRTLLQQRIGITSIYQIAKQLFEGPMPYSTHDLAAATALHFLKQPQFIETFRGVQVKARSEIARWQTEGRVLPMLAERFEAVLASRYNSMAAQAEPTDAQDLFSKAVEEFVEDNKGATPQHAAKAVRDFMVLQWKSVMLRKFGREDFEDDDEATEVKEKEIERAYVHGAGLAAMHAFSVSYENSYLFRQNLVSMYRGWSDVLKIDQEIDDMLKASAAYEQVSDAGISAML